MHHNFKTPLNGILGYSEVIMSEMLGPIGESTYKEYASDIHGAGQELLELIDSLLELKELETRIGAPLFMRKTRPVRFTSAGNRLLRLADEVLPLVHTTEIDLQRLAGGESGRIFMAGTLDDDITKHQ